ncbi:MAG: type II secretion system F family protein [Pseudomonadota bacterium]
MISEISAIVTSPSGIGSLLAAIAVFATIITLVSPLLAGDLLGSRLKAVTEQREKLRRQSRAEIANKSLKKESKGLAKDINAKLNLAKLLEDQNLDQILAQAGFRGPRARDIFYLFKLIMPFVLCFAAFMYVFVLEMVELEGAMRYATLIGGLMAGYYAPSLYVKNVGAKRQQSIMKAFPDALDMILICVESGMSIEIAFQKVGIEIGTASPELAEEFALTTAELSYLQERRMAFENLANRTGHEGVKAVTMALIQAERYGTPLGDALRVMAKENRDMRMSAAEKKAAALPAQLTVPMIVFFLPVLFIVVLGPAAISLQS